MHGGILQLLIIGLIVVTGATLVVVFARRRNGSCVSDASRANGQVAGDDLPIACGTQEDIKWQQNAVVLPAGSAADAQTSEQIERLLEEAREREVETGYRIQETLLVGGDLVGVDGATSAAVSHPSKRVGGDFYDFLRHNDRTFDVLIGDVMGKGVSAALVAAAAKNLFLKSISALAGSGLVVTPYPEEIVSQVASILSAQMAELESFLTVFYGRFDLDNGILTFVDCGHTKTLHYSKRTAECQMIRGHNMPMGVAKEETYRQCSIAFEPGDVFVLYSDGLLDSLCSEEEDTGEERLIEAVRTSSTDNPQAVIDRIVSGVPAIALDEALVDDLTCVVVRIDDAPVYAARDKEWGRVIAQKEIVVHSDFTYLGAIRRFVEDACEYDPISGWRKEDVQKLVLAVHEAATNIIKHAYNRATDRHVRVRVEYFRDRIAVRFHHRGSPVSNELLPAPSFDGMRENGFGLYLISQSVDEVRNDRDSTGGHVVTLVKKRLVVR